MLLQKEIHHRQSVECGPASQTTESPEGLRSRKGFVGSDMA